MERGRGGVTGPFLSCGGGGSERQGPLGPRVGCWGGGWLCGLGQSEDGTWERLGVGARPGR